jgi:hypothetical protein
MIHSAQRATICDLGPTRFGLPARLGGMAAMVKTLSEDAERLSRDLEGAQAEMGKMSLWVRNETATNVSFHHGGETPGFKPAQPEWITPGEPSAEASAGASAPPPNPRRRSRRAQGDPFSPAINRYHKSRAPGAASRRSSLYSTSRAERWSRSTAHELPVRSSSVADVASVSWCSDHSDRLARWAKETDTEQRRAQEVPCDPRCLHPAPPEALPSPARCLAVLTGRGVAAEQRWASVQQGTWWTRKREVDLARHAAEEKKLEKLRDQLPHGHSSCRSMVDFRSHQVCCAVRDTSPNTASLSI